SVGVLSLKRGRSRTRGWGRPGSARFPRRTSFLLDRLSTTRPARGSETSRGFKAVSLGVNRPFKAARALKEIAQIVSKGRQPCNAACKASGGLAMNQGSWVSNPAGRASYLKRLSVKALNRFSFAWGFGDNYPY